MFINKLKIQIDSFLSWINRVFAWRKYERKGNYNCRYFSYDHFLQIGFNLICAFVLRVYTVVFYFLHLVLNIAKFLRQSVH